MKKYLTALLLSLSLAIVCSEAEAITISTTNNCDVQISVSAYQDVYAITLTAMQFVNPGTSATLQTAGCPGSIKVVWKKDASNNNLKTYIPTLCKNITLKMDSACLPTITEQ